MKHNSIGDLVIAIVLIIAATIVAVLRFTKGETTDGILWVVVAAATLFREIRRYIKNQD